MTMNMCIFTPLKGIGLGEGITHFYRNDIFGIGYTGENSTSRINHE